MSVDMAELEAECIVRERPAPPPRGPGLHLELPNMFGADVMLLKQFDGVQFLR